MRLLIVFGVATLLAGCDHRDVLKVLYPGLRVCDAPASANCTSPFALGVHQAGDVLQLALDVENVGDAPLRISSATVELGLGIVVGELPASIEPHESAAWEVTVTVPLGDAGASLLITSNARNAPRYPIELTYRGDPCIDATTRPCGSDVGACALGTQTCLAGVWTSECVGEVGPLAESCNGVDDDCDGELDEGELCDDDLYCTGLEQCFEGACVVADVPGCTDPAVYPDLNTACTVGVCDETTAACVAATRADGTPCDDGAFCATGESCQSGACTGGAPLDCSGLSDACNTGTCDETTDRCLRIAKPTCVCTPGVDNDFDGADECADCNDRDGGVYPGRTEACNGIDDDCDGSVDEDFDVDGDTYSICALRPEDKDCDDTQGAVHPGAPENCDDGSATNTGNGVDDDCDGYVDEGCQPCNATDADGDGVSECDGDCAPTDPLRSPAFAETCDGVDTDCNVFTVDNCDVSDRCNFDLDNNPANDADVCSDRLLCACVLNNRGECAGDYQCTSYCNGVETGALGDLCAADERCSLTLVHSANVHGCEQGTSALGTKLGGEACANDDTECRSLTCAKLFNGPGSNYYCQGYCAADSYCGTNAVCRIDRASMDGQCWPLGRPGTGTTAIGQTCATDSACDRGFCATSASGARSCTSACCSDVQCPTGFTCSLAGDPIATGYALPDPNGAACATSATCPTGQVCLQGHCAWELMETAGMCLADSAAQGTRRAGAACTQGSDCASGFCAADSGTCIDPCCDDGSCPVGLTCELQTVETRPGKVSKARMCVNRSVDSVIERR